ncbi:formate/nitrite transporter family protein [Candidatus Saccharibacteria bacterium]|nr:formate/nitrite transporter family protein [Candidatus Saccharibacteria bacterium]MBQ9403298.1 formate/nitrite transporter family protein [Candidatus Saccharibacteria bacterium]
MKGKSELIRKSIGASLLIALGDYALLKLGNPIGPVIFALGLLGVCYMGQNLFTGKCGFLFQDKIKVLDLFIILAVNLITGYLIGMVFSIVDDSVKSAAVSKVTSWTFDLPMLIKSILCGVIMYIAVFMYRKGTPLGIIFGIPLFIFCGFQHCIANVITMGVAITFDASLIICVLGNFFGSIVMWFITKDANILKAK